MKLVKLITGEEIKGAVLDETDKNVTLDIGMGQLVIEKSRIATMTSILNCTTVSVGDFVETPRGTYLKIDPGTFRLVKGPYTARVDLESIEDGRVVTYEEVFPSEPEIIEEV